MQKTIFVNIAEWQKAYFDKQSLPRRRQITNALLTVDARGVNLAAVPTDIGPFVKQHIYIPEALSERYHKRAKLIGISFSDVIRRALTSAIHNE